MISEERGTNRKRAYASLLKYKSFPFPGHLLSEILLTSTTRPQIMKMLAVVRIR